MGLLNSSVPNLLNGVSQQPDSLRNPTNCEEQVNAYSSPVEGLIKRPPTEFVTDNLGDDYNGTKTLDTSTHLINRDTSEQYILTVRATSSGTEALSVFDVVNNVLKDVHYDTAALGYLTATNPESAFKFASSGDVTFIVNKEKTPKMETTLTEASSRTGIIHVRQGAFSTDYNININGTELSHSSHATNVDQIKTDYIAEELIKLLDDATIGNLTDSALTLGTGGSTDISLGTNIWAAGNTEKAMRFSIDALSGTPASSDLVGQPVWFTSLGTSGSSSNTHFKYYYDAGGLNLGTAKFVINEQYKIKKHAAFDHTAAEIPAWIELETLGGKDILTKSKNFWGAGTATIVLKNTHSNADFANFSFTREESTIIVTNTAGDDYDLGASDSAGDTYIKAFKESTQNFSDLPARSINGFQLRIIGSAEDSVDDYFVRFETRLNETFGDGDWKETVGFRQKHLIDPSVMPHILIRQSDGSFLFKPADGTAEPDATTSDSGFSLPTEETISATIKGEISSNDVTWTLDGLTDGIEIKAGDRFTAGSATVKVVTGGIVENGEVTVTIDPPISSVIGDDQAITISSVSDYRPFSWDSRKAGDELTNSDPSFIGTPINDVFFYENRLGFLSGESVTLSETGQFFNFFRTTVVDLLDTAPIDVSSSSTTIANLNHAIPFKGNLILFSDQNQFVLGSGQQALTPKTVAMSQSSYYEADPNATPAILGSSLFFPYSRGGFSGLKEMTIRDVESDVYTAFDITDHVPQYIPNTVRMVVTMPQENLVIALPDPTENNMEDVYVYKFLDSGNERLLNSWSKFSLELNGDNALDQKQIIGVHVVDNVVYFVTQSRAVDDEDPVGGNTIVYKMVIESGRTDLHSKFVTALDSRVSYDGANGTGSAAVTAAYSSSTTNTTFTLPFTWDAADTLYAYTKATATDAGGVAVPLLLPNPALGTVQVSGNKTGSANHIWFGKEYTMSYKFSKPVYKSQSTGGGQSLVNVGRYQIHSADVVYDGTNTFTTSVAPTAKTSYTYTFTADSNKAGIDLQGTIPLDSDSFRIPIHAKNDSYAMTITSTSPFPVKLLSVEYESQYNGRSRRVGI